MITNSKNTTGKSTTPVSSILLQSLHKTALCFSLDHCFQPEKDIEKVASGEDCDLKRKLVEVSYEKQEEHIEVYHQDGLKEMRELTEYYKYYTQTSINYQPAFYKVMHSHREQKKAVEYNRLKVMLDLSNSTHTNSSKTPRLENSLASSFRLLSMLKNTNSEESILFERLKDKLQMDYGPSRFNTVEQLDKQYCFSKTVNLTASQEKLKARRPSRKVTKNTVEKEYPLFRSKINNYTRNNSCGHTQQSNRKQQFNKSRTKHKKYGSMDNLQTGPKEVKQSKVFAKQNKEIEIKKKIMGMKEQIRKEKQLLMKRTQSTRGKKMGTGFSKRLRT